ncbi:alpha/beta hydrolase [Leptolyngbya sp. FACHB-671]|uniref:alpha/beta fold hydrolase n=1 Tax=Leptolyngbya sp. FACHB-671 TaxID=2692812 RepID=UPI001686DBD8|nr:alpha/beta hydrolase [Leptolyngbya sp. FACHB-671]MBD2069377.1 alpha/beta hydrolase [Leptolyngbya sp. FACHB-671]
MSAKQILTLNSQSNNDLPYQAAYSETGQGPVVLFLHGFMGEGSCWRSLTQLLQPHYRCISLDMLGFGASSKPKIRYDIAKQVAFVRQFVETLNLGSVAIVGHSLGGWVASAYALDYENSVSALILAAPAGIRDDSFCGRYDALRPLLWQTPLVDGMLWLVKPFAGVVGQREGLERISWFRRELNAQPAARSFLVDRLRPEDAIDTVEKEIHRLRVPTLVITGDRDETIPLWHSQTYASEILGAEIVVIPGADHALPQGYASEMAELTLPFLSRVSTASPHQPSP